MGIAIVDDAAIFKANDALGLHSNGVVVGDEHNCVALPVELLSASENPFDWNLIFQLPDGTTRLWWKVSKTTLSVAEPDAPACLSALPERIMALVDHK